MTKFHVVGYYDSESEAISMIEDLKRQGYSSDEISIISKDSRDENHIVNETGTHVADGAATGGLLGGISGTLVGLGVLAIPGIGPIIAAGPILAGITGATAGVGIGGLAGALIGMGIAEEEAALYNEHFKQGKILLLIESDNRPVDLPKRSII
ncbi:general stress protein [Psychrobacillus sp.]|uniref:general stress protein n=1 Tax=Psychrobacillus sp. TaxID=1871623 RepID=UPI0028BD40A1|nr:general stress protein [Psychrobacillus sp.]